MKISTKKIAIIGVLTALCAIINTHLSITIDTKNKLSFVQSICFISGVITGPIGGFTIGALGDLIGCINQGESMNPVIMLGNGFLGLIPGLLFHTFPKIKNVDSKFAYLLLAISYILTFIICTCGINTFATWWFFTSHKKTYFVYLLTRIPFQSIVTLVNIFVSCILYATFTKNKYLKQFFFSKTETKKS